MVSGLTLCLITSACLNLYRLPNHAFNLTPKSRGIVVSEPELNPAFSARVNADVGQTGDCIGG